MTRILLYTGQGRRRQDEHRRRDGRSSAPSAATARSCSRPTSPTASPTRSTCRSAPSRREIAPNLEGQEPDVYYNIARYWRTIQNYVAELFAWRGLDEVMAEEMTVLPGMDELGNLLWIADHVDVRQVRRHRGRRRPDRRDAAAPLAARGEPLVDRADRADRPPGQPDRPADARAGARRSRSRATRCSPPPSACSIGSTEVHRLLSDPDRTSVRIALALDKLSIAEAQRSFTYFHLFGYPSDMVIANRVLPANAGTVLRPAAQGPAALPADGRRRSSGRSRCGPCRSSTTRWSASIGSARSAWRSSATATRRPSTTAASRTGSAARTAAYVLQVELPFTEKGELQLSRRLRRARAPGRCAGGGRWCCRGR